MATTVSRIFTLVRNELNDATGVRWTDATLISYLNDGMLEIVKAKDDAYLIRKPVQLIAGTVFQDGVVPSDIVKLLDITRNLTPNSNASGGYLTGKAIFKVATMDILDKSKPNWYADRPATVIENWCIGDPDPSSFFVSPAPHANIPVWVEILYTQVPPDVAALTDTIPIRDVYRYQLQLFVTGRALMQDIEQADPVRGKAFLDLFYATLNAGG